LLLSVPQTSLRRAPQRQGVAPAATGDSPAGAQGGR